MKSKIILLIIFLLFSTSVLAQSFSIRILDYEPETGNARLRIQNTASTDFHDLKLKIDNKLETELASFVKAGNAFATFEIIPPGEHTLTITTKEGITETKKLYFSPNEAQLKQIIEKNKKIREQQTPPQPIQKTPVKKLKFVYIIIALIIALIIYLIYEKIKHSKSIKSYPK